VGLGFGGLRRAGVVGRKKLKAVMDRVSIEALSARVSPTRQSLELMDAPFGIVVAAQPCQVVSDRFTETVGCCDQFFSGSLNQFFHWNSISVPILGVVG
jgi:hypothetical protein